MMRKALTLLACATLGWGCREHVRVDDPKLLGSGAVVPGSSSSSGSSSVGTSSTGFHAVALRGGDPLLGTIFADSGFGDTIRVALTSDQFADPGYLVLLFSNLDLACSDPLIFSTCDFETTWHVAYAIPLELVHKGAIDLTNPRVGFFFDEAMGPPSQGQCQGGYGIGLGGGGGSGGTLEILRNDDDGLSVKLDGVSVNVPIDGDYGVPRCGPKPEEVGPLPAFAVRGVVVPPSVVPDVAPDAWSIFLTSAPESCGDPWTALDCEQRSFITFELPEELRAPGSIPLADPRLHARFEQLGCGGGLQPFTAGSLQITSANASSVEFQILGSRTFTSYDLIDIDGAYASTPCP